MVERLNASQLVLSASYYDACLPDRQAWGGRLQGTNPGPYGYDGQWGYYTDGETGLLLLTHRYYDPAEGRFVNRDPIGFGVNASLYPYVLNDPPIRQDKVGLFSIGEFLPPWLSMGTTCLGGLMEGAFTSWIEGQVAPNEGSSGKLCSMISNCAGAVAGLIVTGLPTIGEIPCASGATAGAVNVLSNLLCNHFTNPCSNDNGPWYCNVLPIVAAALEDCFFGSDLEMIEERLAAIVADFAGDATFKGCNFIAGTFNGPPYVQYPQ